MRAVRRLLQGLALTGTLIVAVVAIALIVSQTPWFRDWLRRYMVREAKQYLNGELTVGHLGGNLFFGVSLSDVAVDVSGERVVAVKSIDVEYSIFEIIARGVVIDEIRLVAPRLRLERDEEGWNLGNLIKAQEREADREGPGRPITLKSIRIADGTLVIHDALGTSGYRLPERIDDLDVRAAFEYEPVHYTLDLEHVSLTTTAPELRLGQFAGTIAVRDDTLYLDGLVLRTGESSVDVDGVIERYLQDRVFRLATSGHVSLPEIGRIVTPVSEYTLRPAFDIKASGPAEQLELDLNVRSEAGNVHGQVTVDVEAPNLGIAGRLALERLNLAPILQDPDQRTDLTGEAEVNLTVASRPEDAPVLDRLSGSYAFTGPRVVAAGYEATNVRASGGFEQGRITLNARAAAYGGTATAAGFIRPPAGRRPLAFKLRGSATAVNLENLPQATGAPALVTNLSVAEFQVRGTGRNITGTARLNRSEIEGATVAQGTVAEFATTNGEVSYAARGAIADLNLERLGRALNITALARPEYDSRITGEFDVTGAGTDIEELTLDASGTLTDSWLMGARLHDLAFDVDLADGGLAATLKGEFEHLDPGRVAGREELRGEVFGTVDATFSIADLAGPITPHSIAADGRVTLAASTVGPLQIDGATVQGQYANETGEIAELSLRGPDLNVSAAGRIALDRASASNLTYHIEATDLEELGRLAGQEGLSGAAILDGTITGNAASLQIEGTLNGSNLGYQDNNALDLNSEYTVLVPDLSFADARVETTSTATFVKAGALEINLLTAETIYARNHLEFSTHVRQQTRELDAAGQVILHPDHQEIHLPRLVVRTQQQEWGIAAGTEAAVQYGGDLITIQSMRLVSGDQALDVAGVLALRGEDPAGSLTVNANNVDLAQLERLLLQDRGLSGQLSANATISGTAERPLVHGRVEIVNGGFQTYRYESFVADVDFQGNRIGIDARLQQSPAEAITVTGTAPMTLFTASEQVGHVDPTEEERVDLHIQSTDLGLGFIQGLTTAVTNVTGTLRADVRVTGSGHDPHVEGFVDLRNGAFGVPLGGVSYSGLDTRIDFDSDVVKIQRLQIVDEHGQPLTIEGELAVHERQVGAVDIRIESDNFEIIDNELGDVGIDSELRITGELRRPRIVGDVRVQAGRLEVDQILQLFHDPYSIESLPPVVSAEREVEGGGSAREATRDALARARTFGVEPVPDLPAAADEPPPAGAFAPVALDIRVRLPDNLVLRGRDIRPGGPTRMALGDLNITVGGDIRIRKEPGEQVTLAGTVNTVRGTYEFQGRRFTLQRDGVIRFVGDTEFNPLLDVTATRVIPNTGVEARIHITGTASNPELELSSTPPLEESDILALIVFNRPVSELGTGERASLAATAGGIATGFIAAPLGESIGRALDLDLFEITTTTKDGELGAGITIGQQFGDRMFFRLHQQFGDRNISEFMLEYQLARFLRLQGSLAPETTGSANRIGQRRVERAGVDLMFFFSY